MFHEEVADKYMIEDKQQNLVRISHFASVFMYLTTF
jgi:hypothetical protein